jgi:hypothetical protein
MLFKVIKCVKNAIVNDFRWHLTDLYSAGFNYEKFGYKAMIIGV